MLSLRLDRSIEGVSATRESLYFFDSGYLNVVTRTCKASPIAPNGKLVVVIGRAKRLRWLPWILKAHKALLGNDCYSQALEAYLIAPMTSCIQSVEGF